MQYGRLLSFVIGIVGGGLLQLWVLLMVLNANGHPIIITEVLGDGGLFFFSTSLAVGSTINLFDFQPVKVGNMDFNVSLICSGGVVLLAVVYYSAVLAKGGLVNPNPFSNHIFLQIGCTISAIGYWYYTGLRTGLFVKKENDDS